MKIWKLSHGSINHEEYTVSLQNHIATVHSETGAKGRSKTTQADFFKNAQEGDIFYLCRSNDKIELLGEFTDNIIDKTKDGWYQRKYKVIATASNNNGYDGKQKWWTPNDNSTFIEVSQNELNEFVDLVLKPFFGINSIDELDNIRSNLVPDKQPLNSILYGPPGTGKTYNSIIHALSIIDGEDVNALNKQGNTEDGRAELKKRFDNYVKLGQIILTTFHQSYGYEEFVEGIKALEPQSEKNPSEQLIYKTMPGVFKKLCEEARKITYKTNNIEIDSNSAVWKISLGGAGNFHDVKKQCFADNEIRIGWGQVKQLDDEEFSKLETKTQNTITSFMETMTKGDIVLSLHSATEIDGIGIIEGDYERDENSNKEYPHKRKVKWLIKEKPTGILSLNQKTRLVQQTVYRLWRINPAELVSIMPTNEYKIEENNSSKKYILIIDEINRGNISKIFGELITLIEESKRLDKPEELKAKLPYSGEEFGVPQNLYIIGTMNTADRSIAPIDTALRRRFEFVEMMPKADKLKDINIQKDGTIINLQILLETINERIEYLYDRDHQIGHAYFIGVQTFDELQSIFKNKIIPLLQEYFYDDWEKIRLVLADNQAMEQKYQFAKIKAEVTPDNIKKLFGEKADSVFEFDDEKKIFEINESAFKEPKSYVKIYSNVAGE